MGVFTRVGSLCILAMAAGSQPARAQGAARVSVLPSTNTVDAEAQLAVLRLASGTVPTDIETTEYHLRGQPGHGSALRAITELGFALRGTGPALRATSDDPAMMLLVYLAAHDQVGARDAIAALDAARARMAQRNLPPPLALAEAELALGDSAAALRRLTAFEGSWTTMEPQVSWGMVQNGWLLPRTWKLLEALRQPHADAPRADAELLRARPERPGQFRYDAVLWMQPAFASRMNSDRPLARLSFLASEQAARDARGGFRATQSYDSVSVDMPMLDALGSEGMALRRQIQGAAGSMTATTDVDSLGRASHRTLRTAASLPEELRGMLEHGVGFGPLAGAVALPSRAVSVGDTWRDSITLNVPGAGGSTALRVGATYRLARILTVGARRLAFITVEAATAAPLAQPDGGRIEASLTGELVRDLASGESLRLAASLRATLFAPNGAATPVRVLLTAMREADAPISSIAMR